MPWPRRHPSAAAPDLRELWREDGGERAQGPTEPCSGLCQLCQAAMHFQNSTAHVRTITVSDRGTGCSLTACGEVTTQVEASAQREVRVPMKEQS